MLLWKSWSQKDGKIDWWLSVPLPSKGPSCAELAHSHPPLPQPQEDSLGRVPLPSWWWCRPAGVQPPACGRWEMMKKTAVLYIVKRKSTCGKISLELRTLVWFPSQGQQVSEKGLGWSLQARVLAQDRPAINRKQKGGNWGSPWKCPSWTLLQPERTRLQGGARLTVAKGQLQRAPPVTLARNGFHYVQICIQFPVSSLHFLEHSTCFLSQSLLACEEISPLNSSHLRSHLLRVLPWPSSLSTVFPGLLPSLCSLHSTWCEFNSKSFDLSICLFSVLPSVCASQKGMSDCSRGFQGRAQSRVFNKYLPNK